MPASRPHRAVMAAMVALLVTDHADRVPPELPPQRSPSHHVQRRSTVSLEQTDHRDQNEQQASGSSNRAVGEPQRRVVPFN